MPQKKTILFVTNNYTPYSGGVVSSIQSSTSELQKRGHDVIIATLDFLGKKHCDPPFVLRAPCPLKFGYKTNLMAVPWRPANYLLSVAKDINPQIIHVNHPFLLGQSALSVAHQLHIPIVFTYHTMYEHYAHYVPAPLYLTQWALRRIVPSFCKHVNGIIAPSSMIKSMLDTLKLDKPIIVLPSSIQAPFLPAETFGAKTKKEKFNLLYVGRFVKEKNIRFIIDLMKHLPGDRFTLTMIGYGELYDEIKSYAYETAKLSPVHVKFIYKPEKAIIARAYSDADLFLFSSFTDTQALVLAESMAAGTPIVALDGPGQRDIINQGENGFIVANAQEMVACINKIANDKQLHEKLRYNAWLTSQKYTPENTVSTLLEFYNTIMEIA